MKINKKVYSIVKFAIALFVAGLVSILIQDYFKSDSLKPETTLEAELIKTSKKINSKCPVMIDKDTRLDSTEVLIKSNEILYNYTYVNFLLADIDIDGLHNYLDSTIQKSAITEPKMKPMKRNNVTMSYLYRDMNGEIITKISVTPEEYNL